MSERFAFFGISWPSETGLYVRYIDYVSLQKMLSRERQNNGETFAIAIQWQERAQELEQQFAEATSERDTYRKACEDWQATAANASADASRISAEVARLKMEYENWHSIDTPPDPQHVHQHALIAFVSPAGPDDESESMLVTEWANRPADAVMWCIVNSPRFPSADVWEAITGKAE